MDRPFPAYQGDESYIFVSYSHNNSSVVFPELVWLEERGFNIWYDEGIEAGTEWRDEIGKAIKNASLFLFFVSPESAQSENCRKEVSFADKEHIPIITIYLKETALPEGLDLTISDRQAILKNEIPKEEYQQKLQSRISSYLDQHLSTALFDANSDQPEKQNRLLLFASGLGILAITFIGLVLFIKPTTETPQTADLPVATGIPRVAVLPFENQSDDPQQRYFSQGLSEEIATALSRFAILSVVPPLLAAKYNDPNIAADKRSVHYFVRGSVRRSASEVRVSASLVDSRNDSQLWAETYDRELNAAILFDVQAEIAERIATALANASGVVVNIGLQEARRRPTNSLLAYDCVLRGQAYIAIHNEEMHRVARDCLEEAVKIDPNYADALAHLAYLYGEESRHGWNARPKSVDRSLEMAQRALELDSSNVTALMAIGALYAYGMKKELDIGRIYIERGLAINPYNSTLLGMLTLIEILAGDIEKAFEYADRVRELDPTPPLWFYNGVAAGHYLRGEYEMALLELSKRVSSSDAQAEVWRAASLGMLGRRDEARQVLDELIVADPQSPQRILREYVNTPLMNNLADGLVEAGLDVTSSSKKELPENE